MKKNRLGVDVVEVVPAVKVDAGFWKKVLAQASWKLSGGKDDGGRDDAADFTVLLPARIDELEIDARDMDLSATDAAMIDKLADRVVAAMIPHIKVFQQKYEGEAKEFERNLGILAFNDDHAKQAAKEMGNKAWHYLEKRAELANELFASTAATLVELAEVCGKSLKSKWAGGVGTEFADVKLAMTEGNVREIMSHMDTFVEAILGADMLNSPRAVAERMAKEAGLRVDMLMRRRKRVLEQLHIEERNGTLFKDGAEVQRTMARGKEGLDFTGATDRKTNRMIGSEVHSTQMTTHVDEFRGVHAQKENMDVKTPGWAATTTDRELLEKQAQLMGIANAGTMSTPDLQKAIGNFGNMMNASQQSSLESQRLGMSAGLSDREKQLEKSWRGDDFVPWFQGSLANVLDERHAWIKKARHRGMPLEAGISGTTNRLMNAGEYLGVTKPMTWVRLAVMGHLIPIRAHSFHEIMSGARGFPGCKYAPGPMAYRNVAPLDEDTLKRAGGGAFPDEVLGKRD